MPPAERTSWFALKMVNGVGPVSFRELVDALGSPHAVFNASYAELLAVPGINKKTAMGIKNFSQWKSAEKQVEMLQQNDVEVVTYKDECYPQELSYIYDAPPLLFVRGKLAANAVGIALVGSRRASEYGLQITNRIACQLAQKGITIVSGLALGIDAAAHQGAIAGRGKTVAVIGCGLDVIYPLENKRLFHKIPESGGAIVSEYFFGTPPNKENFPIRNRVISGMSLGVVVVEATDKSGSLITANIAAEQGREVFAVPGPIDSRGSRGTHLMLKKGAKLVESVEDIIEEILPQIDKKRIMGEKGGEMQPAAALPNSVKRQQQKLPLEASEEKLLSLIGREKKSLDEVVREAQVPAKDVLSTLAVMEIKGLIKQLPGKMFVIGEENE
ncbi:MAG: DNA-processing protein DprA [Deltaproteobacteria bacterium]|nr:DNA-processing protein DprA [Deltaproteobacteria bacterium]